MNRSILINKNGEIISHYDKINLFDVSLAKSENYLESKNFDSGKKLNLIELPWGNLGMSICYDIRFPNLDRKLAKKGADFFSIPAAFTFTTGVSHWHTLIEQGQLKTGVIFFAPAQCGTHRNGRKHLPFFNSRSLGKILAEADNKEGVTCCY